MQMYQLLKYRTENFWTGGNNPAYSQSQVIKITDVLTKGFVGFLLLKNAQPADNIFSLNNFG